MIALRFGLFALVLCAAAACSDDDIPAGGFPDPIGSSSGGDDDAPPTSSSSSSGGSTSSGSSSGAPSPWITANENVQAAGMQHDYLVVVPRAPSKAVLPIVVAYHGDGGTAQELYDYWKVQEVTGNDAIVVYPTRDGGWNVLDQSSQNPFIAGFEAIVDQVVAQHGGDRADVTAIGWSNGGFFTQILACWRGAELKAVGAMAGSYPYDPNSTGSAWPNGYPKCEGEIPVPAIIVHGDQDGVGNGQLSAEYWTYVNTCHANPDACAVDFTHRTPAARTPCLDYDDAPADAPVRFCPIPNFGHSIWDQSAAAMWEFSRALP